MQHEQNTLTFEQGGLSAKLHRSLDALDELKPFWTSRQSHPNSDFEHFRLICRIRPEVLSPGIMSLWRNHECLCLLAGRIERVKTYPRLGYLNLPGAQQRLLHFIHEGMIGSCNDEEAKFLIEASRRVMSTGAVDLVVFSCIHDTSVLLPHLKQLKHLTTGISEQAWIPHHELSVRPEPGFLLQAMKSKHRTWFKKKAKDFEATFSGHIKWHWHAGSIEQLASIANSLDRVASQTYQRGLSAGFRNDQEHIDRYMLFARAGLLRILVLEAEQRPLAFWIGIVYRGTFHSESTAYLPELGAYEVGTQIFLKLVDELSREGIVKFDFGLGDAQYKQRFSDRTWREINIRLFGHGIKDRLLRNYLAFFEGLDRLLRSMIEHLGYINRLKRTWRRRLASNAKKNVTPSATGDAA